MKMRSLDVDAFSYWFNHGFCFTMLVVKPITLTHGSIIKALVIFALPLMAGNLLQQLYNVVDTMIVGQFLGENPLAAVGSSYTLMTFLTSIILGLSMGSGAMLSIRYGQKNVSQFHKDINASFVIIALITLVLTIVVYGLLDEILIWMNVPNNVVSYMRDYLFYIFAGLGGVFLYNYYASVLRAVGNSVAPLIFLALSAILNIGLDLLLVVVIPMGVAGAAIATSISQWVSGIGLWLYQRYRYPILRLDFSYPINGFTIKEIFNASFLTCLQQSVMNLGILLVQGLINSFGSVVMAGYAAAVKIDSFAYMPVQDFGNAFSTFVAQNYGAGKGERIRKGIRYALMLDIGFSIAVGLIVVIGSSSLLTLFIPADNVAAIQAGVSYLQIVGCFYCGIAALFLLYGIYRAIEIPWMSLVLTILSLGTRVLLAYYLAGLPQFGANGIWWAVPIGWILADVVGVGAYVIIFGKRMHAKLESMRQMAR